jgi:hypothetical protein
MRLTVFFGDNGNQVGLNAWIGTVVWPPGAK